MLTNKNGNVYPRRMGVDKQQKLGLTMKTQDRSMENQENRMSQNKKSNTILYNLQAKKPRFFLKCLKIIIGSSSTFFPSVFVFQVTGLEDPRSPKYVH